MSLPPFKFQYVSLTLLLGNTIAAQAADAYNFNLPAQELSTTLDQLAQSGQTKLIYADNAVQGVKAAPVKGHYTVPQALQLALAKTDLAYEMVDNKVIAVKPEKKATAKSANEAEVTTTLDTVNVSDTVAKKTKQDSNDPRVKSYLHKYSRSATKTDTALMETPASVQVVTKDVMQDQQVSDVKGALENVSGVRPQGTLGSGVGAIIRGFATKNIYRNGLLQQTGNADSLDAGNLDNIEVLKGTPNLYGRSDVGGLISVNTKRAIDVPYYSIEQRFGSYGMFRTQWDAGGALNNDKTLAYRFSGAYQTSDSFRDFVSSDNMLFAPSITWRPTKNTDVTVDFEYSKRNFTPDFGVPTIGSTATQKATTVNSIANIPISRNLGGVSGQGNAESYKVGSEINHKFNDDWAIHHRFLAVLSNDSTSFWSPFRFASATAAAPIEYVPSTGNMNLGAFSQTNDQQTYTTNLDLTGKFDIAGTKHEVLVGFDYYLNYKHYGAAGNPAAALTTIDINNPVYPTNLNALLIANPYNFAGSGSAAYPSTLNAPGSAASSFNSWYGVYFQDQITLFDKLHIMGGGRYDWAEAGIGSAATFNSADSYMGNNAVKDSHFSPRVGISYQPIHELSLYGNWTTSFGVNAYRDSAGKAYAPQLGEQFEAGLKTQLFNDKLLATLAYYHITKDNIWTTSGTTAFPSKQRSQGIELDLSGQITDSLSLIGSYAFTDARVRKDYQYAPTDFRTTEGRHLPNVAEHSGSIWAKYNFDEISPIKGFSVGLGAFAAGKRAGDTYNTFNMPGYVRMDASLTYKTEIQKTKVTAQFNVRNLLDKQYYDSTDGALTNVRPGQSIQPGAPLTAMGSIKVEF